MIEFSFPFLYAVPSPFYRNKGNYIWQGRGTENDTRGAVKQEGIHVQVYLTDMRNTATK
jgi:hypothetical protein